MRSDSAGWLLGITPDPHEAAPRLKRGQFGEPMRPVAKGLVLVVGEKRPVILQPAVHAAILVIADADQFTRLRHRQGLQQHGMHQGEDCGSRPNSQCKRQHRGRGKTGCMAKLPHRIADIVYKLHSASASSIRESLSRCSRIGISNENVPAKSVEFGRRNKVFVSSPRATK